MRPLPTSDFLSTIMHLAKLLLFVAIAVFRSLAAEIVDDSLLTKFAGSYFAKDPITDIPRGLTYGEALRTQTRFVRLLTPELGEPVGFKVGLVTPSGQKRFGIDHPVRATLLKRMLLPNNSRVPARYGTKPILEADLIVRVKDEGINQADSTSECRPAFERSNRLHRVGRLKRLDRSTGGCWRARGLKRRRATRHSRRSAPDRILPGVDRRSRRHADRAPEEWLRTIARFCGWNSRPSLNAVLWLVKDLNSKGRTQKGRSSQPRISLRRSLLLSAKTSPWSTKDCPAATCELPSNSSDRRSRTGIRPGITGGSLMLLGSEARRRPGKAT